MKRITAGLAAFASLTSIAGLAGGTAPADAAGPHAHRYITMGHSYVEQDGTRIALTGHVDKYGEVGRHDARFVVTDPDGVRSGAFVPPGFAPVAFERGLDLGQAGPGWIVMQEGGDFASYQVYVYGTDGVTRLRQPAGVSPGEGFTVFHGQSVYEKTKRLSDHLRTRLTTIDDGTEVAVFRWDVTGPGEGGGSGAEEPQLVRTRIR